MERLIKAAVLTALLLLPALACAGAETAGLAPNVDAKGVISLPKDFRTKWVHLGSWAVPAPNDPGNGFHDVYTQPESVEYYKKNQKFPDGAVLVKEIRDAVWDELPTGHVVREGEVKLWFVMVRDSKGSFPGNKNWGDGWGWALFKPDDPSKNTSTDYKEDCLPCHMGAKASDWVYVYGYPALH